MDTSSFDDLKRVADYFKGSTISIPSNIIKEVLGSINVNGIEIFTKSKGIENLKELNNQLLSLGVSFKKGKNTLNGNWEEIFSGLGRYDLVSETNDVNQYVKLIEELLNAREKLYGENRFTPVSKEHVTGFLIEWLDQLEKYSVKMDVLKKEQTQLQKQMSEQSDSNTSEIIRNEEKKQQAYENTANTQKRVAKNESILKNSSYTSASNFEIDNNSLKKAVEYFEKILQNEKAVVTVLETINNGNNLNSFTIGIRRASGEVESLNYKLKDSQFVFDGGKINDNGVIKQVKQLEKNITSYENRLNDLKAKYKNANIDYSGFEKTFTNFKNGTVTVNELSAAFNNLKNSAVKSVQNLKSQKSSDDPITQAANNIRDLPNMIQALETNMANLKDKNAITGISVKDLSLEYESLKREMDSVGGKVPLTDEWTEKYRNLMSTVSSLGEQIKTLKKVQDSDNSDVSKQADFYSSILSNYRQIYALKKKLLSAGKEEAAVIEEQLKALNKNNNSNYKELIRQGLKSSDWQKQVDATKESLEYNLRIAAARQQDKLAAQESARTAREQVQAEKERLAIIERQKNAAAKSAKKTSDTISRQEYVQQQEVNSILTRQQAAYREIWNVKKKIALLDPEDSHKQIGTLEEKKRFYQEIYLAAQKELQTYNNLSINQEHLNALAEIRRKTELEISTAAAKQLENRTNKIQFQVDTGGYESKVESLVSRTMQWTDENGNARISTDALKQSLDKLIAASAAYANNKTEEAQRRLIESEKELDKQLKTVTNSVRKMNAELAKDSAVSSLHNKIQTFYDNNSASHGRWGAQLKQMLSETASGAELTTQRVREIEQSFNRVATAARQAGKVGKSWFQSLKEGAKLFSAWTSPTMLIMRGISEVKKGINAVKELDTALVDLKKTTTMTSGQLEEFYYDSNNTAKQMGVITKEIIDQAGAWSRLGFNTAETATQMAKYSSMFSTISPGMDLDSATDGLVSVMKAFKIGLEDTDDVVDGIMSKINIIGNTQAINNSDIVDFLTRSSSAMAEANNTLEDTIALGTAMVEITRDAAGAGQVLKTVSMRVRGYDEDTEEFIGGVEELSGKIADLTKTASTPGGISLFSDEAKTEYKSTRQLLQEISKIYDQLTDKNQAELLEALAGKRNGQAVAAILNNFDTVTRSLESMSNSAGSADREMSVIMDGLDYKLNRLKETGTGIAQNLFERDEMKSVVDGFTSFLEIIDSLTSKIGLLGTIGAGAGLFAGFKNTGKCIPVCAF